MLLRIRCEQHKTFSDIFCNVYDARIWCWKKPKRKLAKILMSSATVANLREHALDGGVSQVQQALRQVEQSDHPNGEQIDRESAEKKE